MLAINVFIFQPSWTLGEWQFQVLVPNPRVFLPAAHHPIHLKSSQKTKNFIPSLETHKIIFQAEETSRRRKNKFRENKYSPHILSQMTILFFSGGNRKEEGNSSRDVNSCCKQISILKKEKKNPKIIPKTWHV